MDSNLSQGEEWYRYNLGGLKLPDYYVNSNAQANGDNEVHRSDEVGCQNPASSWNRAPLG